MDPVLFVDDEPNILTAYSRLLRGRCTVLTAGGGEEALRVLRDQGPCSVVISDLRMPGMSGIELLTKVREVAPDTVRALLTGHADLSAATSAINEGYVFRLLLKPSTPATLAKAVADCQAQYRLVRAERELLEQTLSGAVRVLSDVLGLVHPAAFGRASRLRHYVTHMVTTLDLPDAWQYGVAALLSQVGCVGIPRDVLDRVLSGRGVSRDEREAFDRHPEVGAGPLANIPRLDVVARMVAAQLTVAPEAGTTDAVRELSPDRLGALLLQVATAFDGLLLDGLDRNAALDRLRALSVRYPAEIVDALAGINVVEAQSRVREVVVAELAPGMMLESAIRAATGLLLVPAGQPVSAATIELVRGYARSVGVVEPITVRVRLHASVPTADA